KLLMA
ncbi:bacterial regulatory, Fis family protein, partial [Vibrio parahaemolyticus V-223/04]